MTRQFLVLYSFPCTQEMKNAYLVQMRAKEEKMLHAREEEAFATFAPRTVLPAAAPRAGCAKSCSRNLLKTIAWSSSMSKSAA